MDMFFGVDHGGYIDFRCKLVARNHLAAFFFGWCFPVGSKKFRLPGTQPGMESRLKNHWEFPVSMGVFFYSRKKRSIFGGQVVCGSHLFWGYE